MISQNKIQIRHNILNERNSLSQLQRATSQRLIENNFKKTIIPLIRNQDIIAGYFPINSELNILPLLGKLNNQILLPVIQKSSTEPLKFYPWSKNSQTSLSKYANNIPEPSIQDKEEVPTIVIAPLIACDINLNRIGSGKSMYDRIIKKLRIHNPNLLYIALCYDLQLIDHIPKEEHDQKLDIIITESRTIQK